MEKSVVRIYSHHHRIDQYHSVKFASFEKVLDILTRIYNKTPLVIKYFYSHIKAYIKTNTLTKLIRLN